MANKMANNWARSSTGQQWKIMLARLQGTIQKASENHGVWFDSDPRLSGNAVAWAFSPSCSRSDFRLFPPPDRATESEMTVHPASGVIKCGSAREQQQAEKKISHRT
jgi:hypothetical protein